MIKVTVLVDNTAGTLPGRHGFALCLEAHGRRILYDFGPDSALVANAAALGIDLAEVDFGVLSHSHRDHGGGLDSFFAANSRAPVYASDPAGIGCRTRLAGFIPISVGVAVDPRFWGRMRRSDKAVSIDGRFHLVPFDAYRNRSRMNRALFCREGAQWVADDFRHESAFVVDGGNGLWIFNACSHHGAVHTVDRVKALFPGKAVAGYVGGFHLTNPVTGQSESGAFIDALGAEMKALDIEWYTGHCTGPKAFGRLAGILDGRLHALSAGARFVLGSCGRESAGTHASCFHRRPLAPALPYCYHPPVG